MVVNRSAVPVYARMYDRPRELVDAFLWTLKSLGVLLAPVTGILLFAADDLLGWVQKGAWLDAAPMVRWLSVAALMRCIAQTFPQMFHALKRPSYALFDSLLTAVLLVLLLFFGLTLWGHSAGVVVAAWAWNLLYPLTSVALIAMVRQLIPLRTAEIVASLRDCAGALLAMSTLQLGYVLVVPARALGPVQPVVHIGLLVLAFVGYVRFVMGITLRGLTRR